VARGHEPDSKSRVHRASLQTVLGIVGSVPPPGEAASSAAPASRQEEISASADAAQTQLPRRWHYIVVVACAVAFVYGVWNARHQYFIFDEWAYWTERRNLLDRHQYAEFFLRPHYEHWHAITMLIWLPIGRIFGLHAYLPYVIPTIVAHCVAGLLLFELLARARLRTAIAAGAAILYLFLAGAAGNLSFGWQICFVAPIALCYLALLLIEADAGRLVLAALAVLCVTLAMMSSGVGVTVMVVTALAAAARRRLPLVAAILAVPGGIYLLWRLAYEPPSRGFRWSELGSYASYSRSGLESTLEGIAQIHVGFIAWMLFTVAGAGAVIAVARRDPGWSMLGATFVGAVVFYVLLATQRAADAASTSYAPSSARYVHVASALLLPALAYVVDRLVGMRRSVAFVVAGFALWAIAANALEFVEFNDPYVDESRQVRSEIAATVAMRRQLDAVGGLSQPYGPLVPLRIGHVRALAAQDKLPCSTDYAEVTRVANKLQIPVPEPRELSCRDDP
jgi:hypothetical protein